MQLSAGARLGPYEIVQPLGSGGMGEVYRARDTRLGRDVAIKILREGQGDDARRRFRNEGVALCRLSHPNVAAVFDVGTEDTVDYLVMELIPGVSLWDRLQGGPLPAEDVLPLALQLAEGLAAAHAAGIVHRDLKPANIRVTPEGRAKVVDFGLALDVKPTGEGSDLVTATIAGAVSGTLKYLAPEVLSGERADTRSDVYALGVVLYELATGRHPFPANGAIELLNAIANKKPTPPHALRKDLPEALDAVILEAMDRDPSRRPATAGDLLAALRHVGEAPARKAKAPTRSAKARVRSLVVLPLDNLSGDPTQEYFADGMTEALIAHLAKIEGLRVISRTSAMRYKGARRPLPEIAAELGVDAVVEGSVVRSGERVRITAQLIHAASDTHLWAESFDRDLSDVLTLQSEAARAIASEIEIKLTPKAKAQLDSARRVNPQAYESYLRGRHYMSRRTEEGLLNAADYFRTAIDLDPTYALAYVGLADVHNLLAFWWHRSPAQSFPRGKAAALKALELDPNSGEAHISLAYVLHYYEWNWPEAEALYRKGLALNPSYPQGHMWYLNLLSSQKRFDEAMEQVSKCVELDPLSVVGAVAVGWVSYFGHGYDRAIADSRRALELDPTSAPAHFWTAWPLLASGRIDEGLAELEKVRTGMGEIPMVLLHFSYAHALGGEGARAREELGRALAMRSERHVPPELVAVTYMALGEKDAAWEWLERAEMERAHWLVFLDVDPKFEGFRGDPRFDALKARIGI